MKKQFLLTVLICLSALTWGQSLERQIKTVEFEASYLYDANSYRDALPFYEYLDSLSPNNTFYIYRIAICEYELGGLYNAISHFEQVKSEDDFEDKLYYYLGRLYHSANQFDKAEKEYLAYRELLDNPEEQKEVDHYITQCETAIDLLKEELQLKIENIGDVINSPYADYVPLIDAEEKVMIFTSRRKGGSTDKVAGDGEYYEDIYMSKKSTDGTWGEPENIKEINDKYHNASVSISPDATKIYFYESGQRKSTQGIYESKYELNEKGGFHWSKPKRLNEFINKPESYNPSVSVSADGKLLYLASDRTGGYGGLDIYVSELDENDEWSEPINLGENVNTEYDEDAPFIHNSSEVLFYSSKGHVNMGGYDVFFSRKQDNGTWGRAVNFGAPVNSTSDDIFFGWTADETKGYYSSHRAGGYGEKDIYVIRRPFDDPNLTVLKGFVSDGISGKPIKALVVIMDAKTKDIVRQVKTDKNGRYLVHLEEEKTYSVKVGADGYVLNEHDMYVPKEYGYYEMKEDIHVIPYGKEYLNGDSLVVYKTEHKDDVDELIRKATTKQLIENHFTLGDLSRFRESVRSLVGKDELIMSNGDLFSIVGTEKDLAEFGFPMSIYPIEDLNFATDSLLKLYNGDLEKVLYCHGNVVNVVDILSGSQLAEATSKGVLKKVNGKYEIVQSEKISVEENISRASRSLPKETSFTLGDLIKFKDSLQVQLGDGDYMIMSNGDLFSLVGVKKQLSEFGFPMSIFSVEELKKVTDSLSKAYGANRNQLLFAHGDVFDVVDVLSGNKVEEAVANGLLKKMSDGRFVPSEESKGHRVSVEELHQIAKKIEGEDSHRVALSDIGVNEGLALALKKRGIITQLGADSAVVDTKRYMGFVDSLNQLHTSETVLVITDDGDIIPLPEVEEQYVLYNDGKPTDLKERIEELNSYNEQVNLSKGNKIVMRNVLFDFDAHKLKPESYEVLDGVAKIFEEHPAVIMELSGHTDDVGSHKYNMKLSKKRAKRVAKYLIKKKGVSKKRVVTIGFGETKPYASNSTEEGQKLNRRTELKVIDLLDKDKYTKSVLVDLSTAIEDLPITYKNERSPLLEDVKQDYTEGELLPWKVHFPSNQWATITAYSQEKAKQIVGYLNAHPKAVLVIHSHADPMGDFHENKELAKRRGQTVFNFLVAQGIDINRLSLNSYGSENPLVQTESVQRNVVNRRVEFEVLHR